MTATQTPAPTSYHVAYTIPTDSRHLLECDNGCPWDLCSMGFTDQAAAQAAAAEANHVQCHGPDAPHHVVSGAEVAAWRDTEWATCTTHGQQAVTDSGSSAGFSGAPITWADLACGCQLVDASADTLDYTR